MTQHLCIISYTHVVYVCKIIIFTIDKIGASAGPASLTLSDVVLMLESSEKWTMYTFVDESALEMTVVVAGNEVISAHQLLIVFNVRGRN